MADVLVATDGFVGGGVGGWGFVAAREGVEIARGSGSLAECPPHLAEWTAVVHALEWAEATLLDGDRLTLHTDSALVAKGLASRRPAMSGDAAQFRAACRQALARLGQRGIGARVERVPREENTLADGLARAAANAVREPPPE